MPGNIPAEPSREELYEAAVRAVLDLADRQDAEAQQGTAYVATALIPSTEIRAAIAAALQGRAAELERAARDRAGIRAVLDLCKSLDEVPGVGFGTALTGAIYRTLADVATQEGPDPDRVPLEISGPGAATARITLPEDALARERRSHAPAREEAGE
jgi:hypothetical protein